MNFSPSQIPRVHGIAVRMFKKLRSLNSALSPIKKLRTTPSPAPPYLALNWIKSHELSTGGISVHSLHENGYPEVTGYLVPTLMEYGERELAIRLTRWLLCIQRADGAYTSHRGVPYIFDTGQVLRGLLAMANEVPEVINSIERAAGYIYRNVIDNGKGGFGSRYSNDIPESVHLYVLDPLLKAGEVLNRRDYQEPIEYCIDFYCRHPDALKLETLTHFLGYELEALLDLGRSDIARPVLHSLQEIQSDNGAVRAKDGVSWVCSPGLAQLAVCWYKIGMWEPADKAMEWLESHQRSSGGFYGGYGRGADYFPDAELSWAVKYYLDAHRLRLISFMDRNVGILPSEIPTDDGRVQAILKVVNPNDKVAEIGCGTGRFLKKLNELQPDIQCTGFDISRKMLDKLPDQIKGIEGSLESIPCTDNCYDVVFSVEAVEHSPNPAAAIREIIRVARPGGWIIIIDKQNSHWGRRVCPPWERWPDFEDLKEKLNLGCDNVTAERVAYSKNPATDGLMVVWKGRKRSNLTGSKWNEVLIPPYKQELLIKRIRHNQISEYGQVILLATDPGEKVLEVGCGTGEISLQLAQSGRKSMGLDLGNENLAFIQRCASELEISINLVAADATKKIPFFDNEIDCVWSSGLLEHFEKEQRREMLREQARVAKKKVIAIVPNAACVAYRAGKAILEKQGNWKYGLEIPLLSLRDDFEAVGLYNISEFSVGARQGLNFLPLKDSFRKNLSIWIENLTPNELQDCNQGYLLVTIGLKSSRHAFSCDVEL